MRKCLAIGLIAILTFTFGSDATPSSAQETAGQILARLEKLPADKRQAVLIERAKAEREVTFYSSLLSAGSDKRLGVIFDPHPGNIMLLRSP